MSIFTNRDLERLACLRMNWRREFLTELARLRQELDLGRKADIRPSPKAAAPRSAGDRPRRGANEAR